MTPGDSKLEATREKVAEKIRGQAWMTGVSAITHKTGDIAGRIAEALGKINVIIVVGIESAKESGSQSPRVYWQPAKFYVDAIENVAIRQKPGVDKPGAWAYAEAIAAALKLARLEDDLFPETAGDLKELDSSDEKLLIVRVPLAMDLTGNTRSTTD